MTTTTEVILKKPKRIRRWVKRPANPNDEFPNASLSVREVQLLLQLAKEHEKQVAKFKDRDSRSGKRLVQGLIEKLGQVKWSPSK